MKAKKKRENTLLKSAILDLMLVLSRTRLLLDFGSQFLALSLKGAKNLVDLVEPAIFFHRNEMSLG